MTVNEYKQNNIFRISITNRKSIFPNLNPSIHINAFCFREKKFPSFNLYVLLLLIRQFTGIGPISVLSLNYQRFSTIIFRPHMETHQHAIHLLLWCFFNVPCIPLWLETRSANFDLMKWVYKYTNQITSNFAQCLRIFTNIALFLLGYTHFAPFMSLYMCIWYCQRSISNCCHLFHMFIPCCHWFSSIPSLHFCLCGASTPSLLKRLWTMFKIILLVFPMR